MGRKKLTYVEKLEQFMEGLELTQSEYVALQNFTDRKVTELSKMEEQLQSVFKQMKEKGILKRYLTIIVNNSELTMKDIINQI